MQAGCLRYEFDENWGAIPSEVSASRCYWSSANRRAAAAPSQRDTFRLPPQEKNVKTRRLHPSFPLSSEVMIPRPRHRRTVLGLLREFPVVAILGARQVGKTTLALDILKQRDTRGERFDLEDPADVARLSDPRLALADRRGLRIVERRTTALENFTSAMTLNTRTTQGQSSVMGTVLRGEPHIVRINGFWIDFVARGWLLVSQHIEGPGILGRVGTLLGEIGVNISFVQVGRQERGGMGMMVLGIDDPLTPEMLAALLELPSICSAHSLRL